MEMATGMMEMAMAMAIIARYHSHDSIVPFNTITQ